MNHDRAHRAILEKLDFFSSIQEVELAKMVSLIVLVFLSGGGEFIGMIREIRSMLHVTNLILLGLRF